VDLTTFNVHVLELDVFTEIYTHTLNEFFHTVVKTNKIIKLQLLREKKTQELSIQIGSKSKSKQQTDLVNKFATTKVIINHYSTLELKRGILVTMHQRKKIFFIN
jgi:hypothetical protein